MSNDFIHAIQHYICNECALKLCMNGVVSCIAIWAELGRTLGCTQACGVFRMRELLATKQTVFHYHISYFLMHSPCYRGNIFLVYLSKITRLWILNVERPLWSGKIKHVSFRKIYCTSIDVIKQFHTFISLTIDRTFVLLWVIYIHNIV